MVRLMIFFFFFFQAEDGIRDAQESRGLGDVYKRQACTSRSPACATFSRRPGSPAARSGGTARRTRWCCPAQTSTSVSYTHLRAHETPEHLVCRLLLDNETPEHLVCRLLLDKKTNKHIVCRLQIEK